MDIELLNKQNYTYTELNKKLNLIQKDKDNLIYITNKILVNIYEDYIYDKIIDIFEQINEEYIVNTYGNFLEYIIVYNNIIIDIENDIDYDIFNLTFILNKNDINSSDLELLHNFFKFLVK